MISVTRGEKVISTEELTTEAKQQLIARVADSNLFRKSPRLREFLLYAGECTLGNRLTDVREQVIAEKVFQRKAESYDLQDSIVRAEARNLRKRLEKYFETEGSAEAFAVTMPKGGYSLAFEPRPHDAQPTVETVMSGGVTEPVRQSPREHALRLEPELSTASPRASYVVSICMGILAAIAAVLAIHWYPGSARELNTNPPQAERLPFSALFGDKRDTFIVTSDTAFLQISELEGHRLRLDDYLVRAYGSIPHLFPPDLLQRLNRAQFTDAAEMTIAGLIMRRNAKFLQRTYLRSGREVELADFKSHNIVLLGSPVSNPWADLYASQLNFQFDFDSQGQIKFLNRSPHPGESSMYPGPANDERNRTYAEVAFLPNTSAESGSVLLLAGTTAEATAAAGEFLLNEAEFSKTLQKIGIEPKGPPKYYELLLRATTFIGGATQSEVIAHRLHPYSVQ